MSHTEKFFSNIYFTFYKSCDNRKSPLRISRMRIFWIFSVASFNTGRISNIGDDGERFLAAWGCFPQSRFHVKLHILEGRISLFARTTMPSRPPLGASFESLRNQLRTASSLEAFFRRRENRRKRDCTFEASEGPFHSPEIRWKPCKCRLGGPLMGAAFRVCVTPLPFSRRFHRRCI